MEKEIMNGALAVVERNNCRSGDHYYFMTDHKKYPFQSYWDACIQAIVMSLFDGRRAEQEMDSLLSKQFPDGRMPNLTSWERPRFPWNLFFRVSNLVGEDGRANMSTSPMLSAFASWEIYKRTGNREFLEKVLPRLALEVEYMGVQRDLLDDGLVVIVNCLEAWSNESPVFDEIMGLKRPRGLGPFVHLLFFGKLATQMAKYKRLGFDLQKITELGIFLVEDMISNTLFCRSLSAMGSMFGELGERTMADEMHRKAVLQAERLERLCWDETDGFFYSRYGTRNERRFSRVKTLSGLLPLFTGLISPEKVRILVERHLMNTREFYTEFPFPFVAVDEPSYRPRVIPSPFPSMWRGPTWLCLNWMFFLGLKEYGYDDIAERVALNSEQLVLRSGFRKFYNPRTGRGYGPRNSGLSTVVADMLARLDERA